MSGTIVLTQTDTPTAPSAGQTALSFPATLLNQLKFVDGDGNTNILYFPAGGGTLTIPATGTAALTQSPTLITPVLGVATATTINKVTLTAPATGATLTIADGKTLTVSQTLTLTGASGKILTLTDSLTVQGGGATTLSSAGAYTLTIPATGTAALLATANTFTAAQTISGGLLDVDKGALDDVLRLATSRNTGSASIATLHHNRGIANVVNGDTVSLFDVLTDSDTTANAVKTSIKHVTVDKTGASPTSAIAFLTQTSSTVSLEAMRIVGNHLVIGTTTDVTSAQLQVGGTTGALLLSRLTTTQRDALTPTNGMILYNSTLGKFQGYEAGAWANLI